jgi:hypothetical protein
MLTRCCPSTLLIESTFRVSVSCFLQVRYVGVSNETSYGVSEFVHAAKSAGLPRIQTIQNVYHLIQRGSYETDLAETCRCICYVTCHISTMQHFDRLSGQLLMQLSPHLFTPG